MTTLSRGLSAEVYKEILTRRETVGARPVINQGYILAKYVFIPGFCTHPKVNRKAKSKKRTEKQKEKQ